MKIKLISIALALTVFSGAAGANINEAMNRQFGTMQNFTQPAVIVGPDGGVVSGGALRMRMPIESVTPVRITPPSARAGCGGIDVHGGSLSFPSAQEFVQVARSVAGNVGGYAFKLALSSMCQNCENIMSAIQETNNLFNKMQLDSCTLAEDIVAGRLDETLEAAGDAARTAGNAWAEAFSVDAWYAQRQGEEVASVAAMSPEEREAAFEGNYVWQALRSTGSIIPGMEDTTLAREILMSITGTVVMCAGGVDDCQARNRGEQEGEGTSATFSQILALEGLLAGGFQDVYECDNARCLNVRVRRVDIGPSQVTEMQEAFLGPDGILDRMSSPTPSRVLTEEQLVWLSYLGVHANAVINLAASGENNRARAEMFVRDASRTVLANYYSKMLMDVTRQVKRALEIDGRPGRASAVAVINESRKAIETSVANEISIVSLEMMLMEFSDKLMLTAAPRLGVINATAANVPQTGG